MILYVCVLYIGNRYTILEWSVQNAFNGVVYSVYTCVTNTHVYSVHMRFIYTRVCIHTWSIYTRYVCKANARDMLLKRTCFTENLGSVPASFRTVTIAPHLLALTVT